MAGRLPLAARGGVLLASLGLLAASTAGGWAAQAAGPTGGITGTVFGSAGSRLSGATVVVYAPVGEYAVCGDQRSEPLSWRVAGTATTTKSGTYTVAGLNDGAYRLEVVPASTRNDAYGYWVRTIQGDGTPDGANVTPWLTLAGDLPVRGGALSRSVDVHLARPATISGVVTDQATGRALAGVEVRAARAEPPSSIGGYQYLPDFTFTTTDKHGRYTLAGLPRSAASSDDLYYGVVLVDRNGTHDPFIWWHYPDPNSSTPTLNANVQWSTTRDVQLRPAAPLTVQVTNGSNVPVAGIHVELTTAFPYPWLVTDASGVVRLPRPHLGETPPPPEFFTVRISDPGGVDHGAFYSDSTPVGAPSWSVATPISGGASAMTVAMRVEPAAVVTGTLWKGPPADPTPRAAGWRVAAYLVPPVNPQDTYLNAVADAIAGCDGSFTLLLWPSPDQYLVTFEAGQNEPYALTSTTLYATAAGPLSMGGINAYAP